MKVERWVFPPAIAAAVFTTVAIAPPGGPFARGLRVESLGSPEFGRPWLLRLTVESANSPAWHAPNHAVLRLGSDPPVRIDGPSESAYLFTTLAPRAVTRLAIDADGFHATAPVRPTLAAPIEVGERALGENGIDVQVEGGALVPEVPATLLVRVIPPPAGPVALEPSDPSFALSTHTLALDTCGVGLVTATLHAFDATLVLRTAESPPRIARRRIPASPGGVTVAPHPSALEVSLPIGDQVAYVAWGDRFGPTGWTARRIPESSDGVAQRDVPLETGTQWALASLSTHFEAPAAGLWLTTPPSARCNDSPLGQRFARAAVSLPPLATVWLVYDGASIAEGVRARKVGHARIAALLLAALALAMLMAMVISANLRRDPAGLETVSVSGRQRMLWALLGTAALLVGGWVLLSTYVLRL